MRDYSILSLSVNQEESCLYTSASIYEWLKSLRWWRMIFIIAPIIFGGITTWPLLSKQVGFEWITSAFALLAGVTPAVYKALELDVNLSTLAKSAYQFKVLQDRFRQAWSITALGDFDAFKAEFDGLMDRMDAARERSLTPPDRFFNKAREKIKMGHYEFSADESK